MARLRTMMKTVFATKVRWLLFGLVVLSLLFTFVSGSQSGSLIVLGPEDFLRDSGKSQAVTRTFTVANPADSFTLGIENGGQQGQYLRVSSAEVTLNKIKVLRPNDFSQNVQVIARSNDLDENFDGVDGQAAFTLTAEPTTVEVIQGQSVSYVVRVDSVAFTQLATLALSGLPAGVTSSFTPQQITAGQTSLLTITTPSGQLPGSVPFSVSASALVKGTDVTKSITLTLNVLPVTTSFVGRTVVADELQTPLAGVSISLLGRNGQGQATGCAGETVSDAAGNFMFINLPSECTSGQLIRYDGTTATSPPGTYAGVDLFYDIVPNQVTVSPVLIHLPRIDDKEFVCVQQDASQDQTFTFQTIPNMSVTVYAHTIFTAHPQYPPPPGKCPSGSFALIAIGVPVDRLPDAMPPDITSVMPFIVAFQPPNAVASQPVAVSSPNLLNTAPGANTTLMTLDLTKGVKVKYDTGTVLQPRTLISDTIEPRGSVSDNGNDNTGGYNLTLEPITGGTVLQPGTLVSDTIEPRGARDPYTFTLSAPAQANLQAVTVTPNFVPCLELSGGSLVQPVVACGKSGTAFGALISQQLGAGTYFVSVSDNGNDSTGGYNLSLQLPEPH